MSSNIENPGMRLPFKYKLRYWLIVLFIILGGCVASAYMCDWEWLSRSGALIIVITLFAASFNTLVESKRVIGMLSDAFDPSEEIYQKMREKPHLYGISNPLNELQAKELLEQEVDKHNQRFQKALERDFKKDIQAMELQMVAIGTLLWGFADLI